MILRAFKYRLYPTTEQQTAFAKHFGCARWLYNWGLNKKTTAYKETQKSISRFELQAELPLLKKTEETAWLSEVNSQSLQAALEHLDKAYTRFFREKKGFPSFKSKHGKNSFSVPQNTKVSFEASTLTLPKIGAVEAVFHRTFEGKVKTVTVSKTATGKYFASILVELSVALRPQTAPSLVPIEETFTIGIDVGLKDFATLSTGEKIANPKHLKKSLKRLKYLQYKHSKKAKGGKNREKARKRLAKRYEKVTNQRNDFLHKFSTRIVRENQTVCVENLNIAGMMKNHNLAQAIGDVSWSKFLTMVEYKCAWSGKNFVQIGRFEPSSKQCPCGKRNDALTLADRVWQCECGLEHDRDMLAACNIKAFGLKKMLNNVGQELPELTLGESATTRSDVEPRSPRL
jgi:putative transposase